MTGTALDNSHGSTFAIVATLDSLIAFAVNGTAHSIAQSLEDLPSDIQLFSTDTLFHREVILEVGITEVILSGFFKEKNIPADYLITGLPEIIEI